MSANNNTHAGGEHDRSNVQTKEVKNQEDVMIFTNGLIPSVLRNLFIDIAEDTDEIEFIAEISKDSDFYRRIESETIENNKKFGPNRDPENRPASVEKDLEHKTMGFVSEEALTTISKRIGNYLGIDQVVTSTDQSDFDLITDNGLTVDVKCTHHESKGHNLHVARQNKLNHNLTQALDNIKADIYVQSHAYFAQNTVYIAYTYAIKTEDIIQNKNLLFKPVSSGWFMKNKQILNNNLNEDIYDLGDLQ